MGVMDIVELLKEVDISTAEAAAYVKYFDWRRQMGQVGSWEHFTVRAFILSVSYLGKGYYSALRKVKDVILFRDISELEKFKWLRGWIFQKGEQGLWYIIVDGETEDFEEFKKVYKQIKSGKLGSR